MIRVRKTDERGHFNYGWLDTYHSFSFGHFYDADYTTYRHLRVLNDDIILAGQGFGTHGHDNMEIVTYVLDGALEHRDSTGEGSVLRSGGVQRMTAGSGITHSEFNHSTDEELRLLQIWFLPGERELEPGYEEMHVSTDDKRGQLRKIVAPGGGDGILDIYQDVIVYASLLAAGNSLEYKLAAGRGAWIQVAKGDLTLSGVDLTRGDGAAIEGIEGLRIKATAEAEFVIFEMGPAPA
jgi:quercetin 2,3-dioxygenase